MGVVGRWRGAVFGEEGGEGCWWLLVWEVEGEREERKGQTFWHCGGGWVASSDFIVLRRGVMWSGSEELSGV
jgi:hypothetical protein